MLRALLVGLVLTAACTSSGRGGPERSEAAPELAGSPDGGAESPIPARSSDTEVEVEAETDSGGEARAGAMAAVDGFFMAEGAPPPRACTRDSDCVGDTIPDLDQPCCQNPRSLQPHARAYKRWLSGWRAEHCADTTCPPPPPPAMPPTCAFEVVCADQVCADSCKR
jgi:hypothetical protein